MALAEGSIGTGSIDLISTDNLWTMAMTAAIGSCLRIQIFSFVLGVIAQAIQKGKASTCH